MSNSVIGSLRVVLGMDSAAFEDGIGRAQKRANALAKSMQRTGRQLQGIGRRMSIGVTAPLTGVIYKSIAAQKAQEQSIAAVEAALRSMGDGAGFTKDELVKMAGVLQSSSLYGDEEILQKVTANLLTFGNISGEVFERAQQSALDLSARLGQDLQSSTLMLGKALNDPIKGITALTRVGVSFTEQQKEQIKAMAEAGDVAGAQALILAELEKQYAGQAQALANTDSGKITQAMNAIGDASERIGAVVLPVLADLAGHVQRAAEWFQELSPKTQKFVVIGGALAAAIGPVAAGLGLMVTALTPMAGLIAAVVSPLGLLAAGAAAAGVAIWKNWDKLKEQFPAITGRIEKAIDDVRQAFEFLKPVVEAILKGFLENVRNIFGVIDRLIAGDLAGVAEALKELFVDMAANIVQILQLLVGDVVREAKRIGVEIVEGIKAGLAEKWQGLKDNVTGLAGDIGGWFADTLGIRSPSRVFIGFGKNIVDGLIIGLDGAANYLQSAVARMSGALGMSGTILATEQAGEGFGQLGRDVGRVFQDIGGSIGKSVRGLNGLEGAAQRAASGISRALSSAAMNAIKPHLGGGIGGQVLGGLLGGLLSFSGGGWTGDAPRTGGLDGEGGFLMIGHPQEHIYDTKGGGSPMGGTVMNVTQNVDARGADQAAVERVQMGLDELNRSFDQRVAAANSKNRTRGKF